MNSTFDVPGKEFPAAFLGSGNSSRLSFLPDLPSTSPLSQGLSLAQPAPIKDYSWNISSSKRIFPWNSLPLEPLLLPAVKLLSCWTWARHKYCTDVNRTGFIGIYSSWDQPLDPFQLRIFHNSAQNKQIYLPGFFHL